MEDQRAKAEEKNEREENFVYFGVYFFSNGCSAGDAETKKKTVFSIFNRLFDTKTHHNDGWDSHTDVSNILFTFKLCFWSKTIFFYQVETEQQKMRPLATAVYARLQL